MFFFLYFSDQDPDDDSDDGEYAGVISASCIGANGRVSAKVYIKGEHGKASVKEDYSGAGSPDTGNEFFGWCLPRMNTGAFPTLLVEENLSCPTVQYFGTSWYPSIITDVL